MTLLNNAITLKLSIDKLSETFKPIGICITDRYLYYKEYREDKSEENNLYPYAQKIIDLNNQIISGKHCIYFSKYTYEIRYCNLKLKMQNKHRTFNFDGLVSKITDETIKEIIKFSYKTIYKDPKDIKTNVRKEYALESKDFIIDEKMINIVKQMFLSNVKYYKDVEIVPYKINLYSIDNFFSKHKDIIDKNQIATFVVLLYDSAEGGELIIYDDTNQELSWENTNCTAFYPNIIYGITRITDGYKIMLTFKVLLPTQNILKSLDNLPDSKPEKLFKEIIDTIPLKCFGIVLLHYYSYESTVLKGCDYLCYKYLKNNGYTIDIIPILVKYHSIRNYEDSYYDNIDSNVYNISIKYLHYMINPTIQKPKRKYRKIPFFTMRNQPCGFSWNYSEQDYVEQTGENEMQPEEINSIYISKAIIVIK